MTQQLILIAGPYRSGTDGVQARIDENLARLENAALAVYQRGDAIYRIAGASKGADMDIEVAQTLGLKIYTALEDIPQV